MFIIMYIFLFQLSDKTCYYMKQRCFRSTRKTKKNASAQNDLKYMEVSNSFWEGTRREKTCLKKVSYLLTYLLTFLVS